MAYHKLKIFNSPLANKSPLCSCANIPLSSSFFFFFSFFSFFLYHHCHCLSLLKIFLASKLHTHRLNSSRGHWLVDASNSVVECWTVAGGEVKSPLGGLQLSGKFLEDPTIELMRFHFYLIALELSFPSIPRSTVESYRKNFSFFVLSKALKLDLGQLVLTLE